MAGFTKLLEVDDTGYVDIVATTRCRSITIREDKSVVGYPTTDFLLKLPDDTSDAIQFSAGEAVTIPARSNYLSGDLLFVPTMVVGRIKAVDAASTFAQLELLGP